MCTLCGEHGATKEERMKEMMRKWGEMFQKHMAEADTKRMMDCCFAMCASMTSQGKEGKEKKDAV